MSDISTHFGSEEKLVELLEELMEEDLTKWEEQYVTDLMNNVMEYGEDCCLSDGQADKLREIINKYA